MKDLKQLIRESINEYIKAIDEAGHKAGMEARMAATQEAIDKRKKMTALDELDEDMKGMIDEKKVKDINAEVKALEKSLAKLQKQLDKLTSKANKGEKAEETPEEIIDEISLGEEPTYEEESLEMPNESLNESFLYMQKLAGVITEGQYQAKKVLNEDIFKKAKDFIKSNHNPGEEEDHITYEYSLKERDQVLGGGQQAVAEGMEDINDEIYNDIDLAVSNEAYNRFIDAASAISDDLISKGFEAKDIYDYLNARILAEA